MNINDVLYLIQTSNLQGTTKSFLTSVIKAKRLQEGDPGYDLTDEQVREMTGEGPPSGTTYDTSPAAYTTKPPVDNSPPATYNPANNARRLKPGDAGYDLSDEQIREFTGESAPKYTNTMSSSRSGAGATSSQINDTIAKLQASMSGSSTLQQPSQQGRPRKATDARRITDEDLAAMGTSEAEIQKQLGQAAPGAKKQGSGLRSFFSDLSKRLSGGRSKKAPAQPTSQPATRSANPARNISTEEVKRSGLTDEEIRRITGL